jgi:MoaA/NifB/PqqE/SkfB family radical SAM enzyme
MFVHLLYDIPLHNIRKGYIDIPKQMFEAPILLKNGTLSRSKSMNVSQEMYIAAVKAVHPDEYEDMLKPGGYYYDIVNELALNKCAYLTCQYLDEEICTNVTNEVLLTAQMIELKKLKNYPFLRKFDSYSCKNCDYKKYCKPYLTEVF